VHVHWRQYIYSAGADTQQRRLATNPLFNMPDIKTDGSLPVLCTVYHTLSSWSEVTEETPYGKTE